MKNFFHHLSGLALVLGLALTGSALAQTNTETYYAELSNQDRRDVAVPENFSPYGNKTDLNRYGDDGSAAIVDASGVIIWRSSVGVYRILPDTQVAKPLFVSNSECIVWRNAFQPIPDLRTKIEISYFRVDSESGSVRETTVPVDGNKVLNTPLITTTTNPYTLVTTNTSEFPAPQNLNEGNLFVYRLTYDTEVPQLLSANSLPYGPADGFVSTVFDAEAAAAAADGSYIVRMTDKKFIPQDLDLYDAELFETCFFWVRPNGVVKNVFSESTDDGFIDLWPQIIIYSTILRPGFDRGAFLSRSPSYPSIQMVNLSASKFVFGSGSDDSLYAYSRDPINDDVNKDPDILHGSGITGEVISLPNFNRKGVSPLYVLKHPYPSTDLSLFRLNGDVSQFRFTQSLPQPLGTDVSVARLNSEDGHESVALRDLSNQGIVWLSELNATVIPKPNGVPLFVTDSELIIWGNGLAPVQPDGSLPPAEVFHYGPNGTNEREIRVLADATDPNAIYPGPVRGDQIFQPFPFTTYVGNLPTEDEMWKLETGEKIAGNSLRIRRYHLISSVLSDEDGDGIRSGLEEGPFHVIPGAFTFEEAAKDAARRGGKLASISSAEEYQRMALALELWKREGRPVNRDLPTPLWIGLQYSGGSWKWQDGSDPSWIATNWQPGQPSGVPSVRSAGLLGSGNQWLNYLTSSSAFLRGYILELPATKPTDTYEMVDGQRVVTAKGNDSDGDGASDYDELFRLLTDPNVPNFGLSGGIPLVDFKNPLVNGSYEGLLTDSIKGPISSFTLRLTSKGGFTGTIKGATGSGTVRGTFASNGTASLSLKFDGRFDSYLSLLLAPDPVSGVYRIGGRLTGNPANNGAPLVTELRRAAYNKSAPTPDAGSYTISIPAATVAKEGQPNGDGYLIGSISSSGLAKLRGYSSDGQSLSWSGNVLEGDFLTFFSALGKNLGYVNSNLLLRKSAEVDPVYGLVSESDIDGDLLVVRNTTLGKSSQYYAGYSFRSRSYGSVYRKVSYAQLPSFNQFVAQPNNAILKFVDGIYSGQDVVTTWTTNNQITTPKTQTRGLSAGINSSTGEMRGTYNYNDPNQGYVKSKANFGGVVLQKSGEVRGYYTGGTFPGQVLLKPNLDGSTAPVNLISPRSKNVGENGMSYQVYVTSSEPWSALVMPVDTSTYAPNYSGDPTTWVSVTPSSGEGNGVVTVTVYRNNTWYNREATVMIAGLKHKIQQEHGFGGGSGADAVTITPAGKTVLATGATYLVNVENYNPLNSSNPEFDFYSPVDWVSLGEGYIEGNVTTDGRYKGIVVVTVESNPGKTNGYIPRAVDITIGGLPHRIVQAADNPYNPIQN